MTYLNIGYKIRQRKARISILIWILLAINCQVVVSQLPDSLKVMDEVFITGNRFPSLFKEATISVTKVKPYLFQSRITNEVNIFLDQIPGVNVTDNQANIRSGSGWSYGAGSRVMILVDGLPLLTGDAASPLWSLIPVEALESIEVVKGAASVMYGSSALNGIIHFTTKIPSKGEYFSAQFNTGIFSSGNKKGLEYSKGRNSQSFQSFYGVNKGKYFYRIFGNISRESGYRMEEFLNKMRIGGSFGNYFGKDSQWNFCTNVLSQYSNGGSFLLWESYSLGYSSLDSGYNHTLGTRITIDPKLTYRKKQFSSELKFRYLFVNNDNNNGTFTNNQDNKSQVGLAEYSTQYIIPRLFIKTLFGAFYQSSFTASPLFSGEQKTINHALFAQIEKKFRRKLLIQAGLRYEWFKLNSRIFRKPVFRTGINYSVRKAGFLRMSYGEGYRFPSIGESFISTAVGDVRIYPNNQLDPESGWNIELGYKQFFEYRNLKGYADLAWYKMRINDMLEFTFAQWSTQLTPQNLFGLGFKSINAGNGEITGMELETGLEISMGDWKMRILGGYNYSNPIHLNPKEIYTVDSTGNALSFEKTRSDSVSTLKYRYRHLGRLDIMANYKNWEIGIGWKYQSKIENMDNAFLNGFINLVAPGIDEAKKAGITKAHLFDLRLGYQFKNNYRFRFMVNNLFNTVYMTRPADLRPPRLFQIQISYNLQ